MISLDKKYKCMNGTDVRIHSVSDTTSPNLPIKGEIFDEGVWRKFFLDKKWGFLLALGDSISKKSSNVLWVHS